MKTFLTTIILLSSCLWVTAQGKPIKEKALAETKLIDEAIAKHTKNNNYFLYSLGGHYVLIIDKQTYYQHLYLGDVRNYKTNQDTIYLVNSDNVKKSLVLNKYLRQGQLKEAKVYLYDSAHSYTSFRAVYNKRTLAEFYMPFMTYNKNTHTYPIPKDLHQYLFDKYIGLRLRKK